MNQKLEDLVKEEDFLIRRLKSLHGRKITFYEEKTYLVLEFKFNDDMYFTKINGGYIYKKNASN